MKYYLLSITLITLACRSTNKIEKENKTIPYILQYDVSRLLENEMSKYNTKVCFILNHLSGDTFKIDLIKNEDNSNFYASLTNRKILVGKKLYPLVLDLDEEFAASETGDTILKRVMKDKYLVYTTRFMMYHYFYYVVFVRKGDIISDGHDGLIPKK